MSKAPAGPLTALAEPEGVGKEMLDLMRRLYPLCRSLTGDGVRETLAHVSEYVPLEVTEVPTGTRVFDWEIPREWNVSDAWIADAEGRRLVDFRDTNLHVVGYSRAVEARLTGAELQERLQSLPEHPDWIPLRTAYWSDTWGFCVSEAQRQQFRDDEWYDVRIDSRLESGALTYGEALIAGEVADEILVSTYVCHPSVCNDNLSGIVLLALLGRHLHSTQHRFSYRLLFGPGTLGPLAWLSRNRDQLGRVRHGLAVSCVGDAGPIRYKRSRRSDAEIDRAAAHVLRHSRPDSIVHDFFPWGGDERQFCSPGVDLPLGTLTRTPHGLFSEYHSSADNLELVRGESLRDSLGATLEIFDVLEQNRIYESTIEAGEPRLGRRGLYPEGPERPETDPRHQALLWVLNLADGRHSLLEVAERADLPFSLVAAAAGRLVEANMVHEARR